MKVLWLAEGWRGFLYWIGHDPAIALKIATLIEDARRITWQWSHRARDGSRRAAAATGEG